MSSTSSDRNGLGICDWAMMFGFVGLIVGPVLIGTAFVEKPRSVSNIAVGASILGFSIAALIASATCFRHRTSLWKEMDSGAYDNDACCRTFCKCCLTGGCCAKMCRKSPKAASSEPRPVGDEQASLLEGESKA